MNKNDISFASETPFGIPPAGFRLPTTTRIGCVRLAVSSLEASVAFYSKVIGLAVLDRTGHLAKLGAQDSQATLLELEEMPGIHPINRGRRLGLYHTAFLLPSRSDLSRYVKHLQHERVQFGAADHVYSEAIYLQDPDGLTVEVYADRPRSEWIVESGELKTAVDPVRFGTFPTVAPDSWQGAPAATTLGHLHFYVSDLERAKHFYHFALGLDIITWSLPGALFTSAGGYHHHVGLNIWAASAPRATTADARLLFWKILLPNADDAQRAAENLMKAGYLPVKGREDMHFTDPWGIAVILACGRPEGS